MSLKNIYDWYSSDIHFTQPEFQAKVIPYIEQELDESSDFQKVKNRNGESVWKIE